MTQDLVTNIPPNEVPLLTPDGRISEVWWMYFIKLFERTGGIDGEGLVGPPGPPNTLGIGTVVSGSAPAASITGVSPNQTLNLVLEKGAQGIPGPASNVTPVSLVTVTASPFTYTASLRGVLLISGGGISNMEFSRDGTNWYSTGSFYGCFFVALGDQLRITYAAAPQILFASN